MEISGDSLDAVLHRLYLSLVEEGEINEGSRGETKELLGVSLRIHKPRARISRSENRGKPFSAFGELLWYLSGSDKLDFIEPYVTEYAKDAVNGTLEGAYGPRLLAMRGGINQFESIERLLNKKPGSRRAVIQLFNAEDIATHHNEIPCTTTIQFHLRGILLHMSVTLRSNDAYWGLPHDVFCFTMIQEMMARKLGVEIGEYYQYVGSMHVYKKHFEQMREYIAEGVQQIVEMPPMPAGDPFPVIGRLLEVEGKLRNGDIIDASATFDEPYWADITRLLQVYWVRKRVDGSYEKSLLSLRDEISSPVYRNYIDGRLFLESRHRMSAVADRSDPGVST